MLHHVFVLHPGGGEVFEFDRAFAFVAHLVFGAHLQFVDAASLYFVHRHGIGLVHRAAIFRSRASLRRPGNFQFFAVEKDRDVLDARAASLRFGFGIAFVGLVGGFDLQVVDGQVERRGFLAFSFFFGFFKRFGELAFQLDFGALAVEPGRELIAGGDVRRFVGTERVIGGDARASFAFEEVGRPEAGFPASRATAPVGAGAAL